MLRNVKTYHKPTTVDEAVMLVQSNPHATYLGGGAWIVAQGDPTLEVLVDLQHVGLGEIAGDLIGVEAVIDKDFASGLLAKLVDADLLLISTAVEKVAINFKQPDQQWLSQMTVAEAEKYIEEGHFAPGSMLPKMQAIVKFIKETGKKALITNPPNMKRALEGPG